MTLRLILPVVAALSLGGCVVVRDKVAGPPRSKKSGLSASDCHPSQYWDGTQCRHKGKGKGARKHDG